MSTRYGVMFLIVLLAALLLPAVTYHALGAYNHHKALSARYSVLERQRMDLQNYGHQLEDYRAFVERVQQFGSAAEQAGVSGENWNIHEVRIAERQVPYRDLGRFITEAGNGRHYYFLPRHVEIRSEDFSRKGGASPKSVKDSRRPADSIYLSLDGDFLVNIR